MQDNKNEVVGEVFEEQVAAPTGMAVSVRNQQKASLYGIGSVLVGIAGIPNKKRMKKVIKCIRKELVRDMGNANAKELMQQNKGAIEMTFVGIRKFPHHTLEMIHQLEDEVVNDLLPSYLIGVSKLGYHR